MLFDHAPLALVGTWGLTFKRVLIGTGFVIPPDVAPLPSLCPWVSVDPAELHAVERRVLDLVNEVLSRWQEPPLDRLTQLYGDVDERLLVTFPELDHYPGRRASRYWGTWSNPGGAVPRWPAAAGRRIYAYLKAFGSLRQTLAVLRATRQPTLVYVDGLDPALRAEFACGTLAFADEPLDLTLVARQCDLAVLNGGHAATCTMLLAGRPTLQLPFFLEQMLMADAVARCGLGLGADPSDAARVADALDRMLTSAGFAHNAGAFAARYFAFKPAIQQEAMARRLEQVLGGAPSRVPRPPRPSGD